MMYNLQIHSKHTLYNNYAKRFVVCTNIQSNAERTSRWIVC